MKEQFGLPSTSTDNESQPTAASGTAKKYKKEHKRTESVLSRISRLSVKSLGRAHQDEDEEEDEMDWGSSHYGSKCFKTQPVWLGKFYTRFPTCPCLLCKMSWPSIPKWKFTKNFEWRSSSTYERRLISIGKRVPAEEMFGGTNVDLNKMQTVFRGHKNDKENHVKTSKYRLLTFIPVNLTEQFRRMVNLYFLVTLILTCMLPNSPIDPSSWVLSLGFVVVVTMMKQGYEDYLRHNLDK